MNTKLKILHLEDVLSDAELVNRQLKKANINHEILVVDNKADFIKALTNFSPHIILADHTLPSFNSLEALKILKETSEKIPFILITATVSEEYAAQVMREGADDYILKDRPHRLPDAILMAIQKYKFEAERKIYLEKLITSEAQLALKNEQLIKYNQIISHNLRSPVSNILIIADIIDEVTDGKERKKLFSSLKSTALNINETLNVLVDIAKINEQANSYPEHLLFKEVFDKEYNSIAIVASQLNTEFITDFTQCPSIHYPKVYLESIFLNLISNSLKYHAPERSPVISIRSYKQNERSILEFEDNGLGLDIKKFGKKLFGLNQTFHQNKERKGFGLFMIKSQIESKGGKIRAESKETNGIRFIIEFAA
ncbi:MAG: hybrid sensor histidine kinase/response regulator [Ginsengibacter sp.]